MPNRIIRPEILTSDTVDQLTWAEEVFYRRLLSIGDDFGLYDARIPLLRAALFPLRLDRVSDRDVQGYHDRLVELGLVKVYTVAGRSYGQIAKYKQQARSEPKFPLPPWEDPAACQPEPKKRGKKASDSNGYQVISDESNGNQAISSDINRYQVKSNESLDGDVDVVVNGDVIVDEKSINKQPLSIATLLSARKAAENVALQDASQESPDTPLVKAALGMGSGAPPKAPPRESSAHVWAIPTVEQVQVVMQGLLLEPLRNKKALAECAACFIDAHEARGWCDPRGIPIRNWQPAARNFARSYAKNQSSRTSTNQPQKRKDCNDPERYR